MRLPLSQLMAKYQDSVFAAAYSICRDASDSDDIVQETFLRYYQSEQEFSNEEHIKAWLLRVAINMAKDMVLSFWKRNRVPWQDYMAELPFESDDDRDVFEAVMKLPRKYRVVLHLYYYEGYRIREIADLTGIAENTIKSRLMRARRLLGESLKEEWNENE